jgi:phage terminase large subunit-like protein
MAQDRVPALERICRVPYSAWIKQGFIMATQGNAIDLRAVLNRICWGREMFDLREVPYDRLNFRTEALNLIDDGIVATEVQQSFLQLSYATKFLLSAYGDQEDSAWQQSGVQLDGLLPSASI